MHNRCSCKNDKGKPEIVVTDPKQIKPYLVDTPVGKQFN